MSDNGTQPGPLPPPAFPPGSDRRVRPAAADAGVPEDAFISPDAPIEHVERMIERVRGSGAR